MREEERRRIGVERTGEKRAGFYMHGSKSIANNTKIYAGLIRFILLDYFIGRCLNYKK